MVQRLDQEQVLAYVDRIKDELSKTAQDRVRALAGLIDPADLTVALVDALAAATTSTDRAKSQAAFRKFREMLAEATRSALKLE
ncbi:MAG: hypothetical protein LBR33_02400, partial [Propionibacteriaceae bacterium]|nr:hypothetical protein [Propionibacteriaceae bacterium]